MADVYTTAEIAALEPYGHWDFPEIEKLVATVKALAGVAAEPHGTALPLALTEADAHNLGQVMTVCEGCRKGHYSLGGKVTNYPCVTPGCGCWFCNTPIATPAQAHAAGVAAEPNEDDNGR